MSCLAVLRVGAGRMEARYQLAVRYGEDAAGSVSRPYWLSHLRDTHVPFTRRERLWLLRAPVSLRLPTEISVVERIDRRRVACFFEASRCMQR